MVVDGKTAFTGGFNLAWMSTLTKKSALAIGAIPACGCQGPAAWSFATIFLELWASQRPDDPGLDAYREEQPFPAGRADDRPCAALQRQPRWTMRMFPKMSTWT